jgi:hypothetical protein
VARSTRRRTSPSPGGFVAARSRSERLRRLTPRDLLLAGAVSLYLPLAALALDRWGLQGLQKRLIGEARTRTYGGRCPVGPEDLDAAHKVAWLVNQVARLGLWRANCLQRSVVLWWLLLRRGIPTEIRIGVRRRPGSPVGSRSLDFHAWVECSSIVLNDRPDIRTLFATFDRAIAPPQVRWR